MPQYPIFVTGNQNKADYLSKQLGVQLEHRKLELDELQSTDLHVIVEHKLHQAYDACQAPVLVEDVSLVFTALGELPGPYIKWFVESAGVAACCKILDGFDDRSAVIRCTFGYYDGVQTHFFDSETHGSIASKPRGDNGYGFDKFFVHDGMNITRAEMSQSENERTYAELVKPFKQVREFIQAREVTQI